MQLLPARYTWLHLERLPGYEPELDPAEMSWGHDLAPRRPSHAPRRQLQGASVRHTDAPSGLPRVLSWLGRLSCRNTGSHLNGRHPRPVNAYRTFPTHIRLALPVRT